VTDALNTETTIDRPVEHVWAQLVDWGTAARWMPGVDALRAEGPTAVGTRLVFTARGKERACRIVALEPGRLITLRSVQGGVTADYVYHCEPQGAAGTRVTLVADVRTAGAVRLFGPVIRSAIRRADGGQLASFARGRRGSGGGAR